MHAGASSVQPVTTPVQEHEFIPYPILLLF